jgi:hypothetical protein
MRNIPWVTLVIAALFFLSPHGQDLIYQAFFSGEQLSNSISQFLLLVIFGIAIALMAIEWGVKFYLRRRRKAAAHG